MKQNCNHKTLSGKQQTVSATAQMDWQALRRTLHVRRITYYKLIKIQIVLISVN